MGTVMKVGPDGVRCAISPARMSCSKSVAGLDAWFDHLTSGAARLCGPPTTLRLDSHCGPGWNPSCSP